MVKKYIKIICLLAKRSSVDLNDCRFYYPNISSGTFHSVLQKLEKHGLVRKEKISGKLAAYRKTSEFTIKKAIEVVRGINKEKLCEVILKAVNNIVDPASGLTFAEMGIGVSVKKLEQGFVNIEFIPPFCPLASEFVKYINDAVKNIPGLKNGFIGCGGKLCRLEDVEKTYASQFKLASSKDLLDYMR
ncbi:MAG: iron-sulfur cluster assembly protein [Candidatus Jordarchaeaceae archaeon]